MGQAYELWHEKFAGSALKFTPLWDDIDRVMREALPKKGKIKVVETGTLLADHWQWGIENGFVESATCVETDDALVGAARKANQKITVYQKDPITGLGVLGDREELLGCDLIYLGHKCRKAHELKQAGELAAVISHLKPGALVAVDIAVSPPEIFDGALHKRLYRGGRVSLWRAK